MGWGWLPQEGLPPGTLPRCWEPGHRQVERAARELTSQELERFLEERCPFPGMFREAGLQRGTCVMKGRDTATPESHVGAQWKDESCWSRPHEGLERGPEGRAEPND